jgi:ppGpp synthetase/RelA/SpoT-type nucleotidyltranferase
MDDKDVQDPANPAVPSSSQPVPAVRVSSDERLLLDTIDALRGAENLRDRLLSALQSGTPAVADLAYAVKARVKEDYKIIDKIKDRRAGGKDREPQSTYSVGDVTDLVGLRIVTLYRLDLIEVIEALFATIKADTSKSAPFVAESISEITIYSTNPKGDVQGLPELLLALFERHGYGQIARVAEKQSNYSSIHILLRGRGKYRDSYREVPVEIQLRTALEDVWGQIEHSLKYKRKRLSDAGAQSRERARLTTTLSHLGALKTMIDGIAQYADQIKVQIDELEPELRYSESRPSEEADLRLRKLKDLPQEVRDEIAAAIAEAKPALSNSGAPPQSRMRVLRAALSRLEAVADNEPLLQVASMKTRKEANFIVTMQRALIHFQLGNLLENGGGQLQKAYQLYSVLETEFPKRLVVSYRLARTLDAIGTRSAAIEKLREVVARMETEGDQTPADHWIRSAAPRVLGVLLWEEARAGPDGLAESSTDSTTLELLRDAYSYSLQAHEKEVFNDPVSATSERLKAANNLLYFLLEYLEAGGEPREGMSEEDVARYLSELGGDQPEKLSSLNVADTVRRAHRHLGNRPLELDAARAVLRLDDQSHSPRTQIVREAVRTAERTVREAGQEASVRSPAGSMGDLKGEAEAPKRPKAKRVRSRSKPSQTEEAVAENREKN